jgi:PST family polysaccharide transporter
LSKAFEMSLWLILTLAVPLALAIFVSAPDFLQLLWGEKWLPSATYLRFLIVYSILRPLLDDTGALFTATGRPKLITIVLVAQAATLIMFATPLTIAHGAVGTSIGVGIAFIVGIALTYWFVSRTLTVHIRRTFAPPIIAACGSLAVYFIFAGRFDLSALPLFWRVAIESGVTIGAYFALTALLERRLLLARIAYIWRLLRGSPI